MPIHYTLQELGTDEHGTATTAQCGAKGSYTTDDPDTVDCVKCANLADPSHKFRFTETDTARIAEAVAEFYVTADPTDPTDAIAARRVARAAIGCTMHDLTALEHFYIGQYVTNHRLLIIGKVSQ
jgi:hypothetical protein